MLEFLLNRELRREPSLDPNLTVLRYLREQHGRTGTKEGCASGDCGACTLVLAEPGGERLRYRAINSCITLVGALHGKQLISVEDLKHEGALHAVQQAMVDCHGSQCGYCTPGFVMSLFALRKNSPAGRYDPHQTREALAGNLCRCTGYRPILAAAEQACADPAPDPFDADREQILARLNAIAPAAALQAETGDRRCLMPRSLDELAALCLAHPEARLLAGGSDLALEVTQQHRELPLLVHLGQVEELRRLEVRDTCLVIGAARPLADCHQALAAEYPDFGALLERFASLQIRNQATLGGNIGNASPIGDTPPLLIALDAQLVLRRGAERRQLPLQDYFVDYKVTARQPGEFIETIIVPRARPQRTLRAYKVSKRLDDDISAVCAAFVLQIEDGRITDARIAYGGMAAIPKRANGCEQVLLGAPLDDATLERACAALAGDFTPLSDFRASREYRLRVAQNLLRKCFLELQQPGIETRVTDHA